MDKIEKQKKNAEKAIKRFKEENLEEKLLI